jgi:predicted nucleotidyltransferase
VFPQPHATTTGITLDETLARLARHPAVDGLVTIGSTGRKTLTPVSDYDIVVVLSEMPLPLGVGITYIDHRLADILFVTAAQVDEIRATAEPIDPNAWVGRLARWLVDGIIVFDRRGALGEARTKLGSGEWLKPLGDVDAYGAWIGVNYNLLHTRRLMLSDDPVYRAAGELRIAMYGVMNVMLAYFQVRRLLWEGDKAAIRHLMAHDPAFFRLLQELLRSSDPRRSFRLYEQLCRRALAPIGDLWQGEPTVLWNDSVAATPESVAGALVFWEELIGGG